jgi:hypothetical protein
MKKIITLLSSSVLLVFSTFNANALEMPDLQFPSLSGLAVGVAGSAGAYRAMGSETEGAAGVEQQKNEQEAVLAVGYGSVFLEYAIEAVGGLTIGVDYVFDDITTTTTSRTDLNQASFDDAGTGSDSGLTHTNSVKANFTDLHTFYVEVPLAMVGIGSGAYLKIGHSSVDIETQENLGTGSTYSDTQMDGNTVGFGVKSEVGSMGIFFKFEGTYTDRDADRFGPTTRNQGVSTPGHSSRLERHERRLTPGACHVPPFDESVLEVLQLAPSATGRPCRDGRTRPRSLGHRW